MSKTRDKIIDSIKENPEHAAATFVELQIEFSRLQKDNESKQAQIDSLMLEYCPGDMTKEQIANWEAHQVTVPDYQDLIIRRT